MGIEKGRRVKKRPVLMMLGVGALVVASLGFLVVMVGAQGGPLPHEFYGAVKINGLSAPAGTTVEARGENVAVGVEGNPITTEEIGQYGGPGAFDGKLIVQGQDLETGDPIEFYVDGTRAEVKRPKDAVWSDTFAFVPDGSTELDLRVGASGSRTFLPLVTR
jgi:hypothetical protein